MTRELVNLELDDLEREKIAKVVALLANLRHDSPTSTIGSMNWPK